MKGWEDECVVATALGEDQIFKAREEEAVPGKGQLQTKT